MAMPKVKSCMQNLIWLGERVLDKVLKVFSVSYTFFLFPLQDLFCLFYKHTSFHLSFLLVQF